MYINQKQIAEQAGVSCATVSRAFTNSARVSPDTMEKIRRAMEELGLESPRPPVSGAAVPEQVLIVVNHVYDEYYSRAIAGICAQLQKAGMMAVLCSSEDDESVCLQHLEYAKARRFAGVIIITIPETSAILGLLQKYPLPIVQINRHLRTLTLDYVGVDGFRGGYLAAQHLIENGHRRIAYLAGPQESSSVRERLKGFRTAMSDYAIPFSDDQVFWGDNSRECGHVFADRFFGVKNDYTAVFSSSNTMAVAVMSRLHDLGYRIPEDISLIAFDDTPLASDGNVKFTTVGYAPFLLGEAAVDSLLRRMENPQGEKTNVIFSPRLTPRPSVKNLCANV